jgi:hypothetical protein
MLPKLHSKPISQPLATICEVLIWDVLVAITPRVHPVEVVMPPAPLTDTLDWLACSARDPGAVMVKLPNSPKLDELRLRAMVPVPMAVNAALPPESSRTLESAMAVDVIPPDILMVELFQDGIVVEECVSKPVMLTSDSTILIPAPPVDVIVGVVRNALVLLKPEPVTPLNVVDPLTWSVATAVLMALVVVLVRLRIPLEISSPVSMLTHLMVELTVIPRQMRDPRVSMLMAELVMLVLLTVTAPATILDPVVTDIPIDVAVMFMAPSVTNCPEVKKIPVPIPVSVMVLLITAELSVMLNPTGILETTTLRQLKDDPPPIMTDVPELIPLQV